MPKKTSPYVYPKDSLQERPASEHCSCTAPARLLATGYTCTRRASARQVRWTDGQDTEEDSVGFDSYLAKRFVGAALSPNQIERGEGTRGGEEEEEGSHRLTGRTVVAAVRL
jgi:hypothetical protein